LEIFEGCVKTLSEFKPNENDEQKTSNLCILYSIAYIKIYLEKFVGFSDEYDINERNQILEVIKNQNKIMKVFKIYILKILYNLKNKKWNKVEMSDLNRELKDIQKMSDSDSESYYQYFLLNYFIPSDEIDNDVYKKESENFIESIIGDTPKTEKINNLDKFLSLSINKVISNLLSEKYLDTDEGSKNYEKLCQYYKNNFENSNENLVKLMNLFYDKDKFSDITKIKFESACKDKNIIGEPYESLLYGLRFCAQSLSKINNKAQKYLYSSLFSNNCVNNILEKNFIPGSNIKSNKKLESFKSLKSLVYNSNIDTTFFACKCGYYFSIDRYGKPTEEKFEKCPICILPDESMEKKVIDKENIGSNITSRPYYYRIFKNEKTKKLKKEEIQKKRQKGFEEIKEYNENILDKTLEEYKKEVINPILDTPQKGINILAKEDFLNENKSIRKLSKISYRILNFILANHIFFANCLSFIQDKDLLKCLPAKEMNCLEIIQSNWILLEKALKEKNIFSIHAFMNLIFKDISDLISNCKITNSESELISFEENFEYKIQSNIQKYPDFYDKYIKFNRECTKIKCNDIRIIINELFPPLENLYPEIEFPFLKYFMYTEYKTNFIKDFEQEEDYMEKYPLLYNYLNYINGSDEKKAINYLKYLPSFNKFTNSMVNKFSYRKTREEAKKIKVKELEDFDEDTFKEFCNCWKNIYNYSTKYKNIKINEIKKKLTDEDNLNIFLNDNKEPNYIAAACQNFISWQNEFLQPIIESEKINENLYYYIKKIEKKIPLQEANDNEIISIEDIFKKSEYNDFDDLIYTFMKRNIYNGSKIIYQKYNDIIFDFSKIEQELGKLILPEKCLFENEDHLNFVIYWGEGYSRNIKNFYDKYEQIELNEEEKNNIYSGVKELFRNEDDHNIKEFFGSMQLFIFFLNNNIFDKDIELCKIIEQKPEYLNLDEKFVEFFSQSNFKINQFMDIFFYAEHLSFNELTKDLPSEYKLEIDENIKENIKTKINEKSRGQSENEKLSWKELSAVVRRFISRYLFGYKQNIDKLEFQLAKIDLWEQKFRNLNNLNQLINEKIGQFNLNVGQAFKFYELIGEEDKKILISENHDESYLQSENEDDNELSQENENELSQEDENELVNEDKNELEKDENKRYEKEDVGESEESDVVSEKSDNPDD